MTGITHQVSFAPPVTIAIIEMNDMPMAVLQAADKQRDGVSKVLRR